MIFTDIGSLDLICTMAEVEADEAEDKVIRLLEFQCNDADDNLTID